MKGYITIIGMLFIGLATTFFLVNMFSESYSKDSVVSSMIEAGKVASVRAYDHSARVNEHTVNLSIETFERTFEEELTKSLTGSLTIVDFTYHYLMSGEDVKAINIEICDDNGNVYSTNFRQSISEME